MVLNQLPVVLCSVIIYQAVELWFPIGSNSIKKQDSPPPSH